MHQAHGLDMEYLFSLLSRAIYKVAPLVSEAMSIAAISACVENLFGGVFGDTLVMFGEPPSTLPDLTINAPTLNLLSDVLAILEAAAIKEASLFEIE